MAAKKEKAKALVPKLRFPEFRGDGAWTEKALGEISIRIRDKVGSKKLTPVSITAGLGFVDQAKKFGRNISGAQYKNYIHLRRGDFAFNKGNSKTFPQGCIYQLKEFTEAAASTAFICFKLKKSWVDSYFQNLFHHNVHGRELIKHITSGARSDGLLNINPDDFFRIGLPIPPTRAEQQKIADCLGSLDDLIAAHSTKLDALRDHKKGLLQQLFPAEGQTTPARRFPEFRDAGEWKTTTLGQVVDFQSGGTPSKSNPEFWNGSIPWVSARSMKEFFLDDAADHISEAAIANGAKLVPVGTVLMLTRGMTLFKDLPVCVLRRPMSFNQDVKALKAKGSFEQEFVPYLLLGNKERILDMVDAAGHGTGRLNVADLKGLEVLSPHPVEQKRIADCLSSLEALLPLQSKQLEALKTHKKGLMQQLFPNPEETSR